MNDQYHRGSIFSMNLS